MYALRWQSDHTFHPSHRFSEHATKSEKLNVEAQTDGCGCPGHAGVKVNDQAERLVGKATITHGLGC